MYRTPGDIAGCTELNMIAAQEHSGKKKKGQISSAHVTRLGEKQALGKSLFACLIGRN